MLTRKWIVVAFLFANTFAITGCGKGTTSPSSSTPITPPVIPPTFTSVSPATGFAGGGTVLTITGANFQSGISVSIGGTSTTSISVSGSTSLTVTAPSHALGVVDIVIRNPDGGSTTGSGAFTYTANPVPTIVSATPSTLLVGSGTTSVSITGTGFTQQTTGLLNTSALPLQFLSDHQLSASISASSLTQASLARLAVANPSPGGGTSDAGMAFTFGPQLAAERYGHTATTLQDGRVLICGGIDGDTVLATAEIYNPTTNTITAAAGPLGTARWRHTATLLNDGRVLIAGGLSDSGGFAEINTAEVFNPSTNLFTAVGNMQVARGKHGAALLANGKVLLAGSYDGINGMTSEIFDPATNTFAAGPNMNNPRAGLVAVSLNDGSVLVLGGGDYAGDYFATAEVYSTSTNSFTLVGSMSQARSRSAGVLLKDNTVFVAGGVNVTGTVAPVEIYSPVTKTFAVVGSLNVPVYTESVALLNDGRVLIAGGQDAAYSYGSAQIYDPVAKNLTNIPALNSPRFFARANTLASGNVLISGGTQDGVAGLNSTELFSTSNLNSSYLLSVANPVPSILYTAPSSLSAGSTLTINGSNFNSSTQVEFNGDSTPVSLISPTQLSVSMPSTYGTYSFSVTNPSPGGGTATGTQQTAHVALQITPSSPTVLPGIQQTLSVTITGGGGTTQSIREPSGCGTIASPTASLVYYTAPASPPGFTCHVDFVSTVDPTAQATATITVSNSAPNAMSITLASLHGAGLTATPLGNGKFLVLGGQTFNTGPLATADVLDTVAGTSTSLSPMITPRFDHTATLMASGKVLIAGGYYTYTNGTQGQALPTASAEVYDPSTQAFTATGSLDIARSNFVAAPLPSGDVLIAGGYDATNMVYLQSSLIYRASTGKFVSGPTLNVPRSGAVAIVLNSGKILVAGGANTVSPYGLNSAEIYDPTSNTFSLTGNMLDGLTNHAAALGADGRVLIAGGYSSGFPTVDTEYFDPTTLTFSAGPSLSQARIDMSIVPLTNGTYALAGGEGVTGGFAASATLFELVSGSNSTAIATLAPRGNQVALPLAANAFTFVGGLTSDQTADIVTTQSLVASPLRPSLASCFTLSSSYFICYGYDFLPGGTVTIDGQTFPKSATYLNSSEYLQVSTYPSTFSSGVHQFRFVSATGQVSNVLPVTVP